LKESTKGMVYAALATACVTVVTMSLQVPVPQTRGYINLGDAAIMVFALLLGRKWGAVAGGVGSALADVLTGYAHWAPFTLIIKGLEGFIAGHATHRNKGLPIQFLFLLLAGCEMVAGYFVSEVAMYGLGAALAELPGNFLQAGSAVIIAPLLVTAILKTEKALMHHRT